MSTTHTTTKYGQPAEVLPEGVFALNGQYLTVPNSSFAAFLARPTAESTITSKDVVRGATLDAKTADATIKREFPGVPGRARNLVVSAITEGWIAKVTVDEPESPHSVRVELTHPAAVLAEELADLAARRTEADSVATTRTWMTTDAAVAHRIVAVWSHDYDDDALRFDAHSAKGWHMAIGKGDEHDDVRVVTSSLREEVHFGVHGWRGRSEDAVTLSELKDRVISDSPTHLSSKRVEAAVRADKRAQAEAAFDAEKDSPRRRQLRATLTQLITTVEARLQRAREACSFTLDADTSSYLVTRTVERHRERLQEVTNEQQLLDLLTGIRDAEGSWAADGVTKVHVEVAVESAARRVTQRLLSHVDEDERTVLLHILDNLKRGLINGVEVTPEVVDVLG